MPTIHIYLVKFRVPLGDSMTFDRIIKRIYDLAPFRFDSIYSYYRNCYPTDYTSYRWYNNSKDRITGRLYWHWMLELVVENILADLQFVYERTNYKPFPGDMANILRPQITGIVKNLMPLLNNQIPPILIDEYQGKQREIDRRKRDRRKARGIAAAAKAAAEEKERLSKSCKSR